MASQDLPQNFSISELELVCDMCHSSEIKETEQGYVCSECGIVLEIQRVEYHRPYNEERLQHAILDKTQIGNARERYQNQFSRKFHKLNKIQNSSSAIDPTNVKAKVEISRLVTGLDAPSTMKRPVFTKYRQTREVLQPGTKFRAPEKLVPGVMYYHSKINGNPIDETKLIEVSALKKKEFNRLKMRIGEFAPEYYARDRKQFISNRIMQLREELGLDMEFYHEAQAILNKLWDLIKCTKDDVVAGLVSSIVVLCASHDTITVNSICKTLNIQMSTIQSQVKRRIFEQFRVPGFKSLVRSASILRKVMIKLGFFTPEDEEPSALETEDEEISQSEEKEVLTKGDSIAQEGPTEVDIVFMELPELMPYTGVVKPIDHFIFAVRDKTTNEPLIISMRVSSPKHTPQREEPRQKIKFEVSRYHYPKGPPLIYC